MGGEKDACVQRHRHVELAEGGRGMTILLTYVRMIQNLHYSYFSEQLEEKTQGFTFMPA